ncbi:UNVERIFIED_CONTAM: hypothetical protein Sradi_2180200 [Sesamum radiatum]|uniref:Uncharacterized protein n=1 Tax=Sesamum radiatum TaxID=300843 RepID=A0AAW2T198_SESRA
MPIDILTEARIQGERFVVLFRCRRYAWRFRCIGRGKELEIPQPEPTCPSIHYFHRCRNIICPRVCRQPPRPRRRRSR